MTWFKAKGKLVYGANPALEKRADKPWARVETPSGISDYYRHMLVRSVINPFRQEGVDMTKVHPPMIGAHITVINGRHTIPPSNTFWKKYDGKIIEYEYSIELEQVWKFFVLPVRCEFLERVREELGLPPHPFHITVGRME